MKLSCRRRTALPLCTTPHGQKLTSYVRKLCDEAVECRHDVEYSFCRTESKERLEMRWSLKVTKMKSLERGRGRITRERNKRFRCQNRYFAGATGWCWHCTVSRQNIGTETPKKSDKVGLNFRLWLSAPWPNPSVSLASLEVTLSRRCLFSLPLSLTPCLYSCSSRS